MADTIVDASEPVPPTERDPLPQGEPPPESTEAVQRAPKRGRIVLAIVFFLLVLSVAGALGFWLFFLRYKPTARAHIPSGTSIAIRLEVADVLLFGPVREHLVPLALGNGPRVDDAQSPKEPSRAAKIHERTGVHLPQDLREIVAASMDGKSWVLLLGGRIKKGRFVAGLAEVAKEEGWNGFAREGELLVGPGMVVGQADDGTILVGNDRSIVTAALPATDEGEKIGLPAEGAVTFALGKRIFDSKSSPLSALPQAQAMQKIERASGSLRLSAQPELLVRLVPTRPEDAKLVEDETRSMLTALGLLLLLAPDVAGEKDAIRAASVSKQGEIVVISAPWPYEGLDRAASKLADLAQSPKGP